MIGLSVRASRSLSGKVVAAMNIGAQATRATSRQMEQQFLPRLRAAARELGTLLA